MARRKGDGVDLIVVAAHFPPEQHGTKEARDRRSRGSSPGWTRSPRPQPPGRPSCSPPESSLGERRGRGAVLVVRRRRHPERAPAARAVHEVLGKYNLSVANRGGDAFDSLDGSGPPCRMDLVIVDSTSLVVVAGCCLNRKAALALQIVRGHSHRGHLPAYVHAPASPSKLSHRRPSLLAAHGRLVPLGPRHVGTAARVAPGRLRPASGCGGGSVARQARLLGRGALTR